MISVSGVQVIHFFKSNTLRRESKPPAPRVNALNERPRSLSTASDNGFNSFAPTSFFSTVMSPRFTPSKRVDKSIRFLSSSCNSLSALSWFALCIWISFLMRMFDRYASESGVRVFAYLSRRLRSETKGWGNYGRFFPQPHSPAALPSPSPYQQHQSFHTWPAQFHAYPSGVSRP